MPFQKKRSSRDDRPYKSSKSSLNNSNPSNSFKSENNRKNKNKSSDLERKPFLKNSKNPSTYRWESKNGTSTYRQYDDKKSSTRHSLEENRKAPFNNKESNKSSDLERKPFLKNSKNSSTYRWESKNGTSTYRQYDDKKSSTRHSLEENRKASFNNKESKYKHFAADKKASFNKDIKSYDPKNRAKHVGDKKFDFNKDSSKRSRGDETFHSNYSEDNYTNSDKHLEISRYSRKTKTEEIDTTAIRLNRYIANAGICSRRKADELISKGAISVNDQVISELGFRVNPFKDVIRYDGKVLKREKMVYVLLNKPKDYITTTDDPQDRKTVMNLVAKASLERIYPVGRLDRNTTGLLLLTNDGDLAEKLAHPRNLVTKIYQVELNKNLSQGDLNKITYGIELEDGLIKPDAISYVQGGSKNEIGIQIHSGKNRVVRRIFEHLGYEVIKLDRVIYANLTKKNLPRGHWRYLEEKELIQLKHLMQISQK